MRITVDHESLEFSDLGFSDLRFSDLGCLASDDWSAMALVLDTY